jgi:RND superfamily putative drug exporter
LSILASYGALVYIFQEGHFSGLLNFAPEGFVESTIPVLLFCILFGLSMDYEVFLLSRIKEAYDQTGDNARSVALGLERTGYIITSAALILVLVSASFALGDIIIIKAIALAWPRHRPRRHLGRALSSRHHAPARRPQLVGARVAPPDCRQWRLPGKK